MCRRILYELEGSFQQNWLVVISCFNYAKDYPRDFHVNVVTWYLKDRPKPTFTYFRLRIFAHPPCTSWRRWSCSHPSWQSVSDSQAPGRLTPKLESAVECDVLNPIVKHANFFQYPCWLMIIEDYTPQNLGDYHNPIGGSKKKTNQCEEMIEGFWRLL